jgi:hypothetical protein
MEAAVQVIHDNADRLFLWDYERDRGQLVTLYNKAMGSQWNSVTDLDWSIDVDPERLVAEQDSPLLAVARVAGTLPGSPLADVDREGVHAARDRDVQGEPLAVHARRAGRHDDRGQDRRDRAVDRCQVLRVDPDHGRGEAHGGLRQVSPHQVGRRVPHEPVPQGADLVALEDPRWDIAYLGMQIVIESLALAAFGDMLRRTKEPLLTKLLRYVMSDEARHVAFGVLTLSEFYRDLSEAELKERQEFLVDATLNSRARATTPEVWERMGTTAEEVFPFIVQAAQKTKVNPAGRLRPRLLRQAGAQRAQARPARRQQRVPAPEVG